MSELLNISDLCNIIKNNLPITKFKIIGQVCQPKLSQGHLYLILQDKYTSIKAIIWKSTYENMSNKINEGDNITVIGKLNYYTLTGTVNIVIEKIITNNGIGELEIKYNLLKKEFESKNYFAKENKILLPLIIKKILIITSSTGAAIQDFIFNLENNQSKINYEILDVPVQGSDSPNIISKKLLNITDYYDVIIIMRGGGSYQDLFGFSDPQLIEAVYKFKEKKIPILSAIGHQIDNPLLDLVADYSSPTPSLAGQFLVDINKMYISKLNNIKNNYKQDIINKLYEKQKKLSKLQNSLYNNFNNIRNITYKFNNDIRNELVNKKIKLEYLLKSLDNPYIELFNLDLKKINNEEEININDLLLMKWNNKKFKIKILN